MVRISWEEYQRIKDLKELDLEVCKFGCVNILNLGWQAWGKWYCGKCEKEHVLCRELCLPVSRNVIKCELVRKRTKREEEPVKPNKPYDYANCYGCEKELKGASKKGVVKNRNNPGF
jgi:hypothetical protein